MFDWISPLIAIIQTIKYGHGWTFYLGLDSGWTGAKCEEILEEYGITVYGKHITNEDAFWQVPEKQANWAEYLLLRERVPLKYYLFNEQHCKLFYSDSLFDRFLYNIIQTF